MLGIRTLALALVAALAVAAALEAKGAPLTPARGKIRAADFALKDVSGATVRLSDFRGKVTLLNFWATWCPTCRAELPDLERLGVRYRAKGFEVVTVALDAAPPANVAAFLKDRGVSLRTLSDADGVASNLYGVPGVPYTLLLDTQGYIAYRVAGGHDWNSADTASAIESLLSKTDAQ